MAVRISAIALILVFAFAFAAHADWYELDEPTHDAVANIESLYPDRTTRMFFVPHNPCPIFPHETCPWVLWINLPNKRPSPVPVTDPSALKIADRPIPITDPDAVQFSDSKQTLVLPSLSK